jgi:hypothetical protein
MHKFALQTVIIDVAPTKLYLFNADKLQTKDYKSSATIRINIVFAQQVGISTARFSGVSVTYYEKEHTFLGCFALHCDFQKHQC